MLKRQRAVWAPAPRVENDGITGEPPEVLSTSKSGTHWEPRDQGLDGGLVSSLRALL